MRIFPVDKSSLLKSVLAAAVLACTFGASAVTLLSDDRMVSEFSDDGSEFTTPDGPFQSFSTNGQTSSVGPDQFSGSGSGYGESDFFFYIRESTFDITFSVSVPTLMEMSGFNTGEDGSFGAGSSSVFLFGGMNLGETLFSSSGGGGNFVPFEFAGVLAPGTYRLLLETSITPGGFDTFADWNFTADFTELVVPVPAMGWLFGVSLLGLLRRRKSE